MVSLPAGAAAAGRIALHADTDNFQGSTPAHGGDGYVQGGAGGGGSGGSIYVEADAIEGDGTVTIRGRDGLEQVRVVQDQVVPRLGERLARAVDVRGAEQLHPRLIDVTS